MIHTCTYTLTISLSCVTVKVELEVWSAILLSSLMKRLAWYTKCITEHHTLSSKCKQCRSLLQSYLCSLGVGGTVATGMTVQMCLLGHCVLSPNNTDKE